MISERTKFLLFFQRLTSTICVILTVYDFPDFLSKFKEYFLKSFSGTPVINLTVAASFLLY